MPVSDPNAGTMAQRIMQYQAALQLAVQAPQMYDMPLLHRQMLEVLGIRDADKIVPLEDEIPITDPVTENMNIINGEPVKAFIFQDHEAHIQTHTALIQDPKIMEIMSQSPTAKASEAAMASHISEHVAFAYRAKIEKELGVPLPGPNEKLLLFKCSNKSCRLNSSRLRLKPSQIWLRFSLIYKKRWISLA